MFLENAQEVAEPEVIAARQERWAKEGVDQTEDTTDDDLFADMPALPYVRPEPKVGRNDPCPCGSGKKYKKCCLIRAEESGV